MTQASLHQRDIRLSAKAGLRMSLLKFLKTTVLFFFFFWFIGKSGGFREWAEYKSQGLGPVAMYQRLWKDFSISTTSMTLLINSNTISCLLFVLTCSPLSVDNTIAVSLLLIIICLGNCNILLLQISKSFPHSSALDSDNSNPAYYFLHFLCF